MTQQPDLQTLLTDRQGGRSYARLSEDCGGNPTDKRLNQIAKHGIRSFPDAGTIEGLSTGLNVSVTTVVMAAARSLGLRVAPSDPDAITVDGIGGLPASSRDLIVSVAREMVQLHAGAKQ